MSRNDCLIWVGASYPTVRSFVAEAKRQGCSRKLPSWPSWLEPGKSRVFLAHRGGLRSVDFGVVFGYYDAAGVDLVMPRALLVEHRRLWLRYLEQGAEDRDSSPIEDFWARRVPGGLPFGPSFDRSARDAASDRGRGRGASRGSRPTTGDDLGDDLRDDLRDDLIDVIVDVLFDCGGEAPLPPGGRPVSTFQTSLEAERECGFRPRESGAPGPTARRSGVYVVDSVFRDIDDILCELLKELVAEELKRDKRVRGGNGRSRSGPPGEDHPAWKAVDELRARLATKAKARAPRRKRRKGIVEFDQAADRAVSRFAGKGEAVRPAQLPAEGAGSATRETPGLVVFETPYPRFRRLPDASFRGLIRVDGDELLESIAENYAIQSRPRPPVPIPFLYADPKRIAEDESRTFGDLTALLATRCQSSKQLAESFLRSFVDLVQNELAMDHRLTVPGLGSFALQERAARTGVHPKTRKKIRIPAKKVVRFRPAQGLKDRVGS